MRRRARARVAPAALALTALAAASGKAQQPEPLPTADAPPPVPAEVVRVVERPDAAGLAVRELPASLTREEIVRIQVALAREGFDPGSRSGSLDQGTGDALLAFQRRRGLAPCGCPTYEAVRALGIPVLLVVQLSYAEPTAEPRRPAEEPESAGPEGERSLDYWFPVLVHQRVPFEPPGNADGGAAPPAAAPRPRGARPPGVRPAPPPDGRSFPAGR